MADIIKCRRCGQVGDFGAGELCTVCYSTEDDKRYEIKALCKRFSYWKVDCEGELLYEEYEFEGADIIVYGIVDKAGNGGSDDFVYECENYQEAVRKMKELNSNGKNN